MVRKILQMIPAHNAVAVFRIDDKEARYPVICWALVEDISPDDDDLGAMQHVVGMTLIEGSWALSEVDSGDSQGVFVGYES